MADDMVSRMTGGYFVPVHVFYSFLISFHTGTLSAAIALDAVVITFFFLTGMRNLLSTGREFAAAFVTGNLTGAILGSLVGLASSAALRYPRERGVGAAFAGRGGSIGGGRRKWRVLVACAFAISVDACVELSNMYRSHGALVVLLAVLSGSAHALTFFLLRRIDAERADFGRGLLASWVFLIGTFVFQWAFDAAFSLETEGRFSSALSLSVGVCVLQLTLVFCARCCISV